MAANLEDDYIDMEVTSFTNLHTFIATGTFTTPVTSNTPFESCAVSLADSCQSSCSDEPRVADEGSILRYSEAERPKKKSNGSVPGRRAIAHRRSFSISMRRQPAKSLNKKSSTSLGYPQCRPGPGMGIPIAVFEEKYEFELRDREFYSRSYLALQAISATEAEAVEG
ncbi:hypothetical protein YC2023_086042 [Brassica napus]